MWAGIASVRTQPLHASVQFDLDQKCHIPYFVSCIKIHDIHTSAMRYAAINGVIACSTPRNTLASLRP